MREFVNGYLQYLKAKPELSKPSLLTHLQLASHAHGQGKNLLMVKCASRAFRGEKDTIWLPEEFIINNQEGIHPLKIWCKQRLPASSAKISNSLSNMQFRTMTFSYNKQILWPVVIFLFHKGDVSGKTTGLQSKPAKCSHRWSI